MCLPSILNLIRGTKFACIFLGAFWTHFRSWKFESPCWNLQRCVQGGCCEFCSSLSTPRLWFTCAQENTLGEQEGLLDWQYWQCWLASCLQIQSFASLDQFNATFWMNQRSHHNLPSCTQAPRQVARMTSCNPEPWCAHTWRGDFMSVGMKRWMMRGFEQSNHINSIDLSSGFEGIFLKESSCAT